MFSWLINESLGHLPLWLWPALAGGGLTIFFLAGILTHIPSTKPYAMFIKPVSFITFVFGVFMYGGAGVTAIYQAQILEMENKIKVAEQASQDANSKLAQAMANQEHLVRGRAYGVDKDIKANKAAIDAECKRLDDMAWRLYNRGVANSATLPQDRTGSKK